MRRRWRAAILGMLACGACPPPAPAQDAPPSDRPKTALVLSGGGARGAAHIGVLRVLEELHVRPDLIVGTSMGSIVGGLYAAGWSPDEIEALLRDLDWGEVFIDRVDRADKSFRRKQEDWLYLVQAKLRFRQWKPYFPPGLLGGQRLDLLLMTLETRSTGERDFDRFPIPFRAVAADIENGQAVVLGTGSLALAMRASMSIPGAFAPVEIDGRRLVDGGAAANLPVGIAQSLGAERIVAVDISSPLEKVGDLRSFLSIMNQVSSFLTVSNRSADVERLRPGDVLIVPALGDITFSDFTRAAEAVALGEAAARDHTEALRALAVDAEAWERFQDRHRMRPIDETVVDDVRIVNESWLDDEVVARQFHFDTDAPLDREALERAVMGLAALDTFGSIRPEVAVRDGRRVLDVFVPRKPYGRNSLQFGLSLQDDFEGGGDYALTARHMLLAANRRGGEWVNVAQIGSSGGLASEFYQPIDRGMRWFVAPAAEVWSRRQQIWFDGIDIADYRIETATTRLDVGRVFGRWGEIRAGAYWGHQRGDPKIAIPGFPSFSLGDGGVRLAFRVDTLDSTAFGRSGVEFETSWRRSLASLGADAPLEQFAMIAAKPWTFGRNTFVPSVEVTASPVPDESLRGLVAVGGFLRLSGLGNDEILGTDAGIARLLYYRELTRVSFGALSPRAYAGISFEAGNAYSPNDAISWPSLRWGGSIFVGAETVIGPAYLGWGWTEPGRQRIHLTIGRRL